MARFGKIWQDLARFDKRGQARFGKISQIDVVKIWQDVARLDKGGYDKIWQDLARFGKI